MFEHKVVHAVVSWIRWQGSLLDRPGKPKCVVRVNWERLAKCPVCWVLNSHLWRNISCLYLTLGRKSNVCVGPLSGLSIRDRVRSAGIRSRAAASLFGKETTKVVASG